MSVVIPQAVQSPPPLASRRWGEPVRGETLAALADMANHIAGVKCAGQTSCKVAHVGGATLASDPSGAGGTHWVMVPTSSSLSARVEVVISYQGHEHAGGAGLKVRLVSGAGAALDPPGGGWAHELTTANGGIPAGGRAQAPDGSALYPVRRAILVGARSLSLGAGAGSDVFLEIHATQARLLAVWVGEEPRRVV